MVSSKTVVVIAAGIAGSLFLGYCIYFDRKRRSDPLFKQKLKERREKQKKEQNKSAGASISTTPQSLPNLSDPDQVQRYFLAQVQLGEELLAKGEMENGAECLCNAVAVCGQPEHLLQVLQHTVPPHVFDMLTKKLPSASQRLSMALAASGNSLAQGALVEEELE